MIGALVTFTTLTSVARAVTLTQVISREHPSFKIARSKLAIGRDGKVYLASDKYVLRIDRDGTHKFGREVTYALWNVAANQDGVIATANAHFNHSVSLWQGRGSHLRC